MALSFRLASSSKYCMPFWMNVISAPGGTSFGFIFTFWMLDSKPKVKAAWWKPARVRGAQSAGQT